MLIQGNGSGETVRRCRGVNAIDYKKWVDAVSRVRGTMETRHDKVRLDKNERLAGFSEAFWDNTLKKLSQEHVLAYPEVEPLYLKLASFLGLDKDSLVVTAGSDFAIKMAFELFTNPGDKVIYAEPTFAMVDVYAGLYNVEKIRIGYDYTLNLDMGKLMDSITGEVALVIIANPDSPTGTYINNDAMKAVLDKAASFAIPVLIDEAYYGFCPYTAMDLLATYENLIITRTFSKTAGLAGLRIGYLAACPALAGLLYRFRPMYEVNSIAVLFASELLDNWGIVTDYIRATAEGKRYLINEFSALSFGTIDTYANFIHVDFGPRKNEILDGFGRDGILVRGSLAVKGFEGYTRISVGNTGEMQKVVASIKGSRRSCVD